MDGEKGANGVLRWGKREIILIPIAILSPPERLPHYDGQDESHFNVLLTVRDKVTRQCPQTTTFEEKGEPKRTCPWFLVRAQGCHSTQSLDDEGFCVLSLKRVPV